MSLSSGDLDDGKVDNNAKTYSDAWRMFEFENHPILRNQNRIFKVARRLLASALRTTRR